MKVIKRDGKKQEFMDFKIFEAMKKSFQTEVPEDTLYKIINEIREEFKTKEYAHVEEIQDIVEKKLMEYHFYDQAKAYILYREKRMLQREDIFAIVNEIGYEELKDILDKIQKDYPNKCYSLSFLKEKFVSFVKDNMNKKDKFDMLIKASVELISKEAPDWEFIASRLLNFQLHREIDEQMLELHITSFYEKIVYLTNEGYYGSYILEHYTKEEIIELENIMNYQNDSLLTYSGLELMIQRYLIRTRDLQVLERPQEMFLGIAMHLAMNEKDKVHWAKEIYGILSSLKVTMATPTMSNARKPFFQLSSCFIDTVDDTLSNIYKSIDNFAQVSKFGGGMGIYLGKVRANGSSIRGFKGAAGGVIRWIKLINDTAVAVDQLGVRQGAAAVYLDAWHKDLPEFLCIRTNNGDDRMKAHDIFPGVCYPDLFWKLAKKDLDATWYLMCPHEIWKIKGYHLEDYYGDEWEARYLDCVKDERITKREMSIKDIVRLIIKSLAETGTPFTFHRDIVNKMNPNSHKGIIYCSNLCTEIAQNMSSIELCEPEILVCDGEEVVIHKSKPGDFVVCNLASLSLGNIDVTNDKELEHIISVITRALDNVIDLNFYPIPYAKITNQKYRPIGLGISGYHHMLVNQGFTFESEEHLEFVDQLFEKINYYAIKSSNQLAKEKGIYTYFKNSEWDTGKYFEKRDYNSKEWQFLQQQVHEYGMRNGYLLAIAPTSSTSIIAGTSAGVDPILNKYYLEEKKGSMIARVAPNLNNKTFWLYKNAHYINQDWIIRAAGIRQRHIDQSQSVNLYITNDFTYRNILDLYIYAWEQGVKTLYYVRSKSLEVEECESCSA